MEEEIIVQNNVDHPIYEQDYEDIGILKLCRKYIITRTDLFNHIKENITDFNSFQFDNHTINQQAPLLNLVETLLNNLYETDLDSENILHILYAKHAVMGNTENPTSYSYSISKYRELLQTPTVNAFSTSSGINCSSQMLTRTILYSLVSVLQDFSLFLKTGWR
jgi:hypothetical protein